MKLALIFFSILTSISIWFTAQETPPATCRGKSLSITMLPGPKMSGPSLPLRFGGTRQFPGPPINSFPSESSLRLVIKSHEEFSDSWKRLTSQIPPANGAPPPPPEVDFSKEMVVIAAMGSRPTSGYWIIIDGACEVDGKVEVFVSNVEDASCAGSLQVLTYPADAVRIPRTDLPIIFRETQISCTQWHEQLMRLPPGEIGFERNKHKSLHWVSSRQFLETLFHCLTQSIDRRSWVAAQHRIGVQQNVTSSRIHYPDL